MKKSVNDGSLESRIARFLLTYRLNPHPSTGRSPAEMLMSRRQRSLLDLVRPDTAQKVQHAQEQNAYHHDRHSRQRAFSIGDSVLIRNGSKWLKGQIVAIRGPLSYTVSLQDGRQVRRHVDHVQRYYELDDLPTPVSDPPLLPLSLLLSPNHPLRQPLVLWLQTLLRQLTLLRLFAVRLVIVDLPTDTFLNSLHAVGHARGPNLKLLSSVTHAVGHFRGPSSEIFTWTCLSSLFSSQLYPSSYSCST